MIWCRFKWLHAADTDVPKIHAWVTIPKFTTGTRYQWVQSSQKLDNFKEKSFSYAVASWKLCTVVSVFAVNTT